MPSHKSQALDSPGDRTTVPKLTVRKPMRKNGKVVTSLKTNSHWGITRPLPKKKKKKELCEGELVNLCESEWKWIVLYKHLHIALVVCQWTSLVMSGENINRESLVLSAALLYFPLSYVAYMSENKLSIKCRSVRPPGNLTCINSNPADILQILFTCVNGLEESVFS